MGRSGTKLGSGGLPLDMTAGEKTQRDAGSIHTDRIGKVFIVVGQNVRKCLVCEQLFTRRAASARQGGLPFGSERKAGLKTTRKRRKHVT